MDQELIKSRNVARCVSAALALFNGNIKRIVSALWLPVITLAIVTAANMTISFSAERLGGNAVALVYLIPLLFLLAICVYVWMSASFFNLLNTQGLKQNVAKVSKVVLAYIGFVVAVITILGVAFTAYHYFAGSVDTQQSGASFALLSKALAVVMILAIIFGILILPFVYSYFAYMLEEGTFRKTFFPSYKVGFRHWGFIFIVYLVLGLIMFVMSCVLAMPLIILTSAQTLSIRGMAWGDPSGLPSYFPWLFFVTVTIIYFILYFLLVCENLVFYYAYGSIKKNELDRNAKLKEHPMVNTQQ